MGKESHTPLTRTGFALFVHCEQTSLGQSIRKRVEKEETRSFIHVFSYGYLSFIVPVMSPIGVVFKPRHGEETVHGEYGGKHPDPKGTTTSKVKVRLVLGQSYKNHMTSMDKSRLMTTTKLGPSLPHCRRRLIDLTRAWSTLQK